MQRYGDEVLGGSEGHARTTAVRLARRHTVEIATTTALDFWTWANHFPAGTTAIDGITVRRFPVARGRSPQFKDIEQRLMTQPHTLEEEQGWLAAQGPHVPELLDFLHGHGREYDAVLFYTYIYEPTAAGLPIVPERAALISTAHDEAPIRLAPYQALFQLPRAFGFLTPEERDLVHGRFNNEHIPHQLLGIGMDPPPDGDSAFTMTGDRPWVLYLGQVSEGKGVDDLLTSWTAYRGNGGNGTLVLAGTPKMDIPKRDDVVALGRVSDAAKWGILAAADALVLPSRFESLGIVLLEAWQAGTPVLVPATNAVTSGQVGRSRGGLTYDAETFDAALAALLADGPAIGARGQAWVREECSWDAFDERLERLVALAAG
ncbi:MAG TPA: glycosyltransferase family 4 protein [Methylomirabilota bacterium]|nr:glycosyltransferase family 4 protein [Methylomirabilota bacterium]